MDEDFERRISNYLEQALPGIPAMKYFANMALDTGAFNPEEKAALKKKLAMVEDLFKEIIEPLIPIGIKQNRDFLLKLIILLHDIHSLGSHTRFSAPMRKAIRIEQAKLARSARAQSSKERLLVAAISAEVAQVGSTHALAVSENFAGFIRPGVLQRLRIPEDKNRTQWPAVGTIKARLSKLKRGGQDFKS